MILFGGIALMKIIRNLNLKILFLMKKSIFIIFILAAFVFTSCEKVLDKFDKDAEFVSDTSIYPIFVFEGSDVMTWEIGTPWVEPGYHCSEIEEGADDLTSTVIVDASEVNVQERGLYSIKYSATNKFGYKKTVQRSILVTEPLTDLYDISGTYYLGFNPSVATTFATISPSETKGFWEVSNMQNGSKIVKGKIADLGDRTYVIVPDYYQRKLTLEHMHYRGIAVFTEGTTSKIAYTLDVYYEETGETASVKTYEWKKIN